MNGPHPDRVGDKELLDVAARAIDQMIRDMREMTLQRNEWRDRARSLARANEALARTPWSRIRGPSGATGQATPWRAIWRATWRVTMTSHDESPDESPDEDRP